MLIFLIIVIGRLEVKINRLNKYLVVIFNKKLFGI